MNLTNEEAMALLDLVTNLEQGAYHGDLCTVIRFLILREERREAST